MFNIIGPAGPLMTTYVSGPAGLAIHHLYGVLLVSKYTVHINK